MARPVDAAASSPVPFADTGLGRGWEPAALMTITLLLLSFGLVTLYSASSFMALQEGLADYHFVVRQAAGAALGLVALVLASRVPYSWWRPLSGPVVLVAWMLLMVLIVPGTESVAPVRNGARRWLVLGPITFQPSEIAKVALLLWTADAAVRKQHLFRSLSRGLGPFLVMWTVVLVPVLLEPDLSTALLIGIACATVVFCAGGRIAHFAFLGLLVSPILWHQIMADYREIRIDAFWNPQAHAAGAGYQVQQSLIGIGSGGVVGVGFGEGRQKLGFLPEAHNDFIFSMIGEEWGFIGVLVLVAAYLALVLIGFRIARRAPDLFGELLAVGCTSLVALHAFLHMAVALGLVPPTGLPLPLISDGRSNLVVTLGALGILMSVARGIPEGRVGRA